jgi:hypothetical protein
LLYQPVFQRMEGKGTESAAGFQQEFNVIKEDL